MNMPPPVPPSAPPSAPVAPPRKGLSGCALAAIIGSRPRLAVLSGTLLALCLGLMLPYEQAPNATLTERRLRLLSFNIFFDNAKLDQAVDHIRATNADVVILLEVAPKNRDALRPLDRDYPYRIECWQKRRCDILVLSRAPLKDLESALTVINTPPAWAAAELDLSGCRFSLVAAHLSLPFPFHYPGEQGARATSLSVTGSRASVRPRGMERSRVLDGTTSPGCCQARLERSKIVWNVPTRGSHADQGGHRAVLLRGLRDHGRRATRPARALHRGRRPAHRGPPPGGAAGLSPAAQAVPGETDIPRVIRLPRPARLRPRTAAAVILVCGLLASPLAMGQAGTSWSVRTPAAANGWHAVAHGEGLFVAVARTGSGNRVMTSPDGTDWTVRASAADNDWTAVTYGRGVFVAVARTGAGNRVMTSPDGISWTPRASAADNDWTSVAYGNGTFVAVAQSALVTVKPPAAMAKRITTRFLIRVASIGLTLPVAVLGQSFAATGFLMGRNIGMS
mgnify:CR=1 FL=1